MMSKTILVLEAKGLTFTVDNRPNTEPVHPLATPVDNRPNTEPVHPLATLETELTRILYLKATEVTADALKQLHLRITVESLTDA